MPRTQPGRSPRSRLRGLPLHALCKWSLAFSVGASLTPLAHSDGTTYSTGLAEIRAVPFPDSTLLRMDAKTALLDYYSEQLRNAANSFEQSDKG